MMELTRTKRQRCDALGEQRDQQASFQHHEPGSSGDIEGEPQKNVGGMDQQKSTDEADVEQQHPCARSPFHYIIGDIKPLPTTSSPELRRAGRVRETQPGAYALAGVRPVFRHPRPAVATTDMEEARLESTTQNETEDQILIHAEPIEEPSEQGNVQTAEPLTERSKRHERKKLCLLFSVEAVCAKLLVAIILVAFLACAETNTPPKSPTQQHGAVPIDGIPVENTAAIPEEPSVLMDRLKLPGYTLRAMENPRSPQSKAYQWLSRYDNNHNISHHLPEWRLTQRFALATFYYSTKGDNWVNNHGWLDWDINECQWEQLPFEPTCDDFGHLTSLHFGSTNNLDGTLPPELSLLATTLQSFLVGRNYQLKGIIPTEVGLMTRLTVMGFSETSLSGTVPSEMGRLQSLDSLVIDHSKIGGTVPSELGNLSSLIWLVFESTNFSGSFPSEVFLLSNLRALQVFECPGLKTESVLHGVVRNMHKIERLGLGRGKSGRFISVPTEIARLTNMLSLSLLDFQLNGTLPSEVGLLTKLTMLRLHENAIVGALPTEFLKLSGLNILDIGSNQMEGKLEQSLFSQLTQLHVFSINGNWFSGSLPTEVGLLSSLRKLQLHNTNLSGTLPTELQLMDKLTSLVVMNTSLSGSIPSKLCSAILPPQELKCFGGECYKVATTSLSACHGTRLCGCSCDPCPV